jgi:hypothetical protein
MPVTLPIILSDMATGALRPLPRAHLANACVRRTGRTRGCRRMLASSNLLQR